MRALTSIPRAGRIEPTLLEAPVRAFARAQREAGVGIVATLSAVKDLVREGTGPNEAVLTPRVVGWAVAGYYAGTSAKDD